MTIHFCTEIIYDIAATQKKSGTVGFITLEVHTAIRSYLFLTSPVRCISYIDMPCTYFCSLKTLDNQCRFLGISTSSPLPEYAWRNPVNVENMRLVSHLLSVSKKRNRRRIFCLQTVHSTLAFKSASSQLIHSNRMSLLCNIMFYHMTPVLFMA